MLTPWKESHDQPRQHIKKQRHYFANKGPSSQGYGFSSGHVWMWELDCEESWAPKNFTFWTVVLEKTLESPLDCKEIQAVHPKGDESWVFFGRNDANLKLQYFGHLMQRADALEKTLMLGGIGGRWDGWMALPTWWMWVWVNSGSCWWTGRPGVPQFMGLQFMESDTTERLNWTELNSAYKLNKQGDYIQPWWTPFPIWNQSVVPFPVLTVASWPAYRFLKRQVSWSGIPISFRIFQFIVIHTVKGFGIVNKAEIDVSLEFSCFFHDPVDAGNLISGSSAFSKTSLNIRKFTVHVLLKPGLENFKHYFTRVWDECNCGSLSILWHCLSLGLE